jgi:hypothetical protein
MPTDKTLLNKGIKYLFYAVPLYFIGPSIIYNAFENPDNGWHYVVLGIGILLCFGAIYFTFKGISTMVKSMFDPKL